MNLNEILSSIDSEITRLEQVRALLAGQVGYRAGKGRAIKKRTLSAEARERIAAAQRKRWAAQKKAAKKAA
jgi:hypothetical protein